MNTLTLRNQVHLRRLALAPAYEGKAPRYTSYPTAVQFTPQVDADTYAGWLETLPAADPVSLYVHVP
ncbi:MAG TPA: coproporphyrinogen III oxidase, partial [Caulobacteraceae bacterium]|nr:coproporphyrinogen III oxidase [Caulobacteraceae bacterium]